MVNPPAAYRTFNAFARQSPCECKVISDVERALLPAAEKEVADELREERRRLLAMLAAVGMGSWISRTEAEAGTIAAGIAGMYSRLYRRAVPGFAERQHRTFSPDPLPADTWTEYAVRFVQDEAGNLITNVQGTTRDEMIRTVRSILDESLREGYGTDVAARNLRRQLESLHRSRSVTIARTELLRASNVATDAAMQELVKEGYPMWKRWLWSGISRETHSAIDGQERPHDDYFDVGAERAMYPLAPTLSAEESINCGCTMALFIKN